MKNECAVYFRYFHVCNYAFSCKTKKQKTITITGVP